MRWPAHSLHSNSSQRYSRALRSGLHAGQSSSPTPNSLFHVFMDLTLCTGHVGTSINCSHKVSSIIQRSPEGRLILIHIEDDFTVTLTYLYFICSCENVVYVVSHTNLRLEYHWDGPRCPHFMNPISLYGQLPRETKSTETTEKYKISGIDDFGSFGNCHQPRVEFVRKYYNLVLKNGRNFFCHYVF